LTIKYRVGVKNGKSVNEIIISSKKGTIKFGRDGDSISGSASKNLWNGKKEIFTIPFPPFPAISLGIYAGGSLDSSISTDLTTNTVKISLTGTLTASAEVKAGADKLLSFSGGAEGTVISASGFVTISKDGVTPGFKISGGKVDAYVVARALTKEVWKHSLTIFEGWQN